mmetsp:Transcript_23616/g.51662  ORF Transcript_23616/g.51662 Transcript_23616/m.51662 type:complete len:220 (-) Transcript_23616:437-1096(-)
MLSIRTNPSSRMALVKARTTGETVATVIVVGAAASCCCCFLFFFFDFPPFLLLAFPPPKPPPNPPPIPFPAPLLVDLAKPVSFKALSGVGLCMRLSSRSPFSFKRRSSSSVIYMKRRPLLLLLFVSLLFSSSSFSCDETTEEEEDTSFNPRRQYPREEEPLSFVVADFCSIVSVSAPVDNGNICCIGLSSCSDGEGQKAWHTPPRNSSCTGRNTSNSTA